jgi:cobalt-zinc-cadmium efflux system membrane fusion protein
MIGQVEIQSLHSPSLPYLPETTVQKYGNESFVFIEQANGSYKRQAVVLGDHVSGGYFITSGIHPGERVVDKGSFTLKAEMLKSTTSGHE